MDQKQFSELLARAEKDPEFLHTLTFSPEKLLGELQGQVDRQALGRLIAKQPAEIIARTVGINQACGNTCTSSCDNTCGQSCGFTTNLTGGAMVELARNSYFSRFNGDLQACGNTCTSSCDNTCGQSCGFTTNLTDFGRFGQFNQGFR